MRSVSGSENSTNGASLGRVLDFVDIGTISVSEGQLVNNSMFVAPNSWIVTLVVAMSSIIHFPTKKSDDYRAKSFITKKLRFRPIEMIA